MVCPACQADNKQGAKFCRACGTSLALRCPACGAPHEPDQRFCDACGTALTTAPPAPSPGAIAPAPEPASPGAAATAELRTVSVLFVDLVGFTSLSESRDAEDVRELLGRYFEAARTIVGRYGGTIEKFIGDAVMAVWGVPVAREDDAERAVRAALDVIESINVFGAELGAPALAGRAGVVTGQVAAMENPDEGLVVGDRVNTAARVQSAARPGSVYVDEVTRQVTSAAVLFEDAGEHSVKGKADPLRLWRAVRVVAGVRGSEREQGLEAPFVGRDGDLRLLKELFHGALERRSARLVAVCAEAGLGKSRLRREFSHYSDGLAGAVLWHTGRCLSYGEGVAYWALNEMVRQRLGIPEEASAAETNARLAAGLERWVPEADDREFIAPRLGALLGVAEPGLGRDELFSGWRMFFERLAAHEPVVLVFEDMQWAGAGLLDFIEQLLDWSADSPIFILTLARPQLAAGREGWPAGHRAATLISLQALEHRAMRELLAGVVALPDASADRIVAQAEGVPLYAIETVRALADRGVLVDRDGTLVLDGELGQLDVPASLSSLLAARLDALEPEERALVKAMSVFGGAFPRSAAAALSDIPDDRLDAVLAALVRKQVLGIRADPLSPDRGQYAFTQGLLRTVAYEMLSRQERKPRHLAAADHLRHAFPNEGEDVAEVIASHHLVAYRAAADDADAPALRAQTVAALGRAGQRAMTVGAPETAERLYASAIELADDEGERAVLQERAGEAATQAGRFEAALELFEAAAGAHSDAGRTREAALIVRRIGRALVRLRRLEDAADRVAAALEVLGAAEMSAEVAELNALLGQARFFGGHLGSAAAEPLDAALRVAEALHLPEQLCRALEIKATLYLYSGRPQEARIIYGGALELAERHNPPGTLLGIHHNAGNLAQQWDLPEARHHFEEALTYARRDGDRYGEAGAVNNLMLVNLYAGRWEDIDAIVSGLHADVLPFGDAHYTPVLLHSLRGEVQAARRELAGLKRWEHADDTEFRFMATSARIALDLAVGNREAALSAGLGMLAEAIATVAPSNDAVRQGWADTLQAALALGRLDDARALVALLADQPSGRIPPFLEAQLARGRALVTAAAGDLDGVRDGLQAAIERFAALGYPYWVAVTQADLASWLIEHGSADEAGPLLEQASAMLSILGAAPALARVRELGPVGQAPAGAR